MPQKKASNVSRITNFAGNSPYFSFVGILNLALIITVTFCFYRKGLYCGKQRSKKLFKGEYVCKSQNGWGGNCVFGYHCKEGLLCLPEIYNERGKPPRRIPNKKYDNNEVRFFQIL